MYKNCNCIFASELVSANILVYGAYSLLISVDKILKNKGGLYEIS